MKTVLKTAPTAYPVSLQEAKEHLRVTLGYTDEDEYIKTLIHTATELVEQITRRRLLEQTWYYYPVAWPTGDQMPLPYGKLNSVTAVKYTNSSEVEATFSASDYYLVDTNSEPGKIVLRYGENWPSVTLSPSDPIEVEFVCGYGDSGSDVPPTIIHTIKYVIATAFENRESVVLGAGLTVAKPHKVEDWLHPYKVHGVF